MTAPNMPTGQEPAATPNDQTSATPAPTDSAPPWERDGQTFDPARAWTLIEKLRADLSAAKNTAGPAAPAASETAPPAAAPATADPIAAQVETLRLQLAHERVGRKHSLDDDLMTLLGSGTDDEINARGQLIAERLGITAAVPVSPVTRRPVEQLRGGGNPAAPVEETDPAKLADQIRSRRPF